MGQNALKQGITLFGGEFLAVVQSYGDMFRVQNNSGRKDRAADRAASDFIDAGNQARNIPHQSHLPGVLVFGCLEYFNGGGLAGWHGRLMREYLAEVADAGVSFWV